VASAVVSAAQGDVMKGKALRHGGTNSDIDFHF
jgi:hypothetical protein